MKDGAVQQTLPPAAQAANARGVALAGQGKHAAAKFLAAIAEETPTCARTTTVSIEHDRETALQELAWLGDRASWDDEGRWWRSDLERGRPPRRRGRRLRRR